MTSPSLSSSWEQPGAVPTPVNVAEQESPVAGYAWTKKRGWFQLPLDAQEDPEGLKIWHHDTGTYKTVIGEDLNNDDDNASAKSSTWDERGWPDNNHGGQRNRDGDVPEWDGKSEHRTTYFRRIDLWASTTGVPPKQRGCRLLQKLKGEAFEKLENVMPDSLLVEDSIDQFKEYIINVYEPIEDYRIGKIMDNFLNEFQRKNDQEIVDYNLAWARELSKVEKVAGELQGKWKAHLYFTKMRLKPEHKSQVLTGTLGKYTVEALSKAALTTLPDIKGAFRRGAEREGGGSFKTGGFRRKQTYNHNGSKFGSKVKKSWRANEAHLEDEDYDASNDEDWDDDPEDYDEGSEEEPGDEAELEDCPDELETALVEAEAFLTRAKKQRAEVEKARGFFRKGADSSGKDQATSSMKARLPCSKCKQFGHWHKDPQCPMKDKPFPPGSKGGGKGKGKRRNKGKKKKKRDKGSVCNLSYVVTIGGLNIPFVAFVDTACARSVTGHDNAEALYQHCKARDWPVFMVDDHEPFRFGPGRRVWSEKALVVAVIWGGFVVVLRFSVVAPEVPFLISKYVFKRLATRIDLDDNVLEFKRFNNKTEPLYDLSSGHVTIELVKENDKPPEVHQEALDLCKNGDEVTVNDPEMRKRLAETKRWDNQTHVVQLPHFETQSVSFDLTANDSEPECKLTDNDTSGNEDDYCSDLLTHVCTGKHKSNARTRAAPFYNELAPGWRARALELAPPYQHHAPHSPRMEHTKDTSEDDTDDVEQHYKPDAPRGRKDRQRTPGKRGRTKRKLHLDDEQSRARGESSSGSWHDPSASREGDGDDSTGTDPEPQGSDGSQQQSVNTTSQGPGRHEQGGVTPGMQDKGIAPSRGCNATQNDSCNPGGRSERTHDVTTRQTKGLGDGRRSPIGSISREPQQTQLGELQSDLRRPETRSVGDAQSKPSLYRWASNFVTRISGRTATLVNRVTNIHANNEYYKAIQDKETWTTTTANATSTEWKIEGLDNPVWKQTTLIHSGELIESTPLPSSKVVPVPDGPQDIKTTVWYGNKKTPKVSRTKRNLLKGIQTTAAVLLLEAMVLMSATTSWSGSWTQRFYGTGTADVWEVFGNDNLTSVSWKQGWRPLEPLQSAEFNDISFLSYVNTTLEERAPRLVVMETPNKVWYEATRPVTNASNAERNNAKRFNQKVTPFLEVAHEISQTQVNEGKDFLLEMPLTTRMMEHRVAKQMALDPTVHVMNGTGWNRARPVWWMSSSPHMTQRLEELPKTKYKYSPNKVIQNVMIGFAETLQHKEPERIQSLIRSIDTRLRGLGLYADDNMVNLAEYLGSRWREQVYAIIDEKGQIPEAGIEFDIPPELHGKIPKALLSSVRRLHFNSGHPPNDELERIVRLSGGSELARAAVKGIRCTICRKAAPTKPHKPAKARTNIGQFNETVLADLCYEKDATGTTHGWMLIVDEGTDWTVCKYLGASTDMVGKKTAKHLYNKLEEGWIDWAGPPDIFVADGERGFAAEEFADKLGKAGSFYQPSAGYAPWQKGKVERKVRTVCSIIKKTVLHLGLKGEDDMRYAGIEATSAVNHRPGPSGVSPGMLLFGQKLKLYGELYSDGEPAYHHLDGNDASSELGRRLQIRCTSRQATEAHYAKEMVRKTVAARTRLVEKTEPGETVFFYRCYPSAKAQKLQAQRGCYLGPGLVIGTQGSNYWISYAGRCYLVAPEHLRSLAPDEVCSTKPLIRSGLEELRRASKSAEHQDLTRQEVTPLELQQAADLPAGNDFSVDAPMEAVAIPETPAPLDASQPITVLEPPPEETQQLQQTIDDHMDTGDQTENTTGAESATKRPRTETDEPWLFTDGDDTAASSSAPAVTWKPQGAEHNLKWKKSRSEDQGSFPVQNKRILTAKIKKKMLDKEIPYQEIPFKDRELYHEAEKKEWADWLKNKSVRIVKGKEVKDVLRDTPSSRIINIRFVYRDKNASIRTPQVWLPVKAKARMCAQGFTEPLAKAGLVKLDSPTVQRVGIMVFLQLTANFGWYDTWRKGDVSSAFLQGAERDSSKGRLFLRPPRGRPLAGVDDGDLLEVLKSVYGLPDAPRAWWEEVTGFLRDLGFQHSRLDVAFMVCYHDDGSLGAMIILHVDDVMVSTDGTPDMEAKVEAFHDKYPFGEWEEVSNIGEVAYTGRQIALHGQEIHLGQRDFINGRMDPIPYTRQKKSLEELCTPTEHAEYRSGVGNLHWATSQTRVDHAVDTSRLQKRQNAPTHGDYKDLVKVVKEIKSTANVVVKIRPIENMCVAAYTDSSLYGSEGELIPDDDDLAGYDKHKLHSQGGSLIITMNQKHLDDVGDVAFSMGDWRTRSSRRVFHSTFAAEAQAAVETYGLAKYYRAYLCDIIWGFADWRPVESFGETEIPIVLFTDCKSLFDHLKKDGSVPDDKWVAVSLASLRGAVSAGPGRDIRKSEAKWVPSRWQLADCLTKKGLAASFRERLITGTTRLHELSLQSMKKGKQQKGSSNKTMTTWLTYANCHDNDYLSCAVPERCHSGNDSHPGSRCVALGSCELFPQEVISTTIDPLAPVTSVTLPDVRPVTCSVGVPPDHYYTLEKQVSPLAAMTDQTLRHLDEMQSRKVPAKLRGRRKKVEVPEYEEPTPPEFTPSWSMLNRWVNFGPGETQNKLMARFEECMAADFHCLQTDHREKYLEKFISGPRSVKGDKCWALIKHCVDLMPAPIELYVLETDSEMRELWMFALREWPWATPCLLRMEEHTYQNKLMHMTWMGLLVNMDYWVEYNNVLNDKGQLYFSAYIGMTLTQLFKIMLNPNVALTRQARFCESDNVQWDEVYGGDWETAVRYVIPQAFNRAQASHPLDVICVCCMVAQKLRPKAGTGGRVKLLRGAVPALVLMRPDDGCTVLRAKDRYMTDYQQDQVDQVMNLTINHEDKYKDEKAKEADLKGYCYKNPRYRNTREVDHEIEANTKQMLKVKNQLRFHRIDGTPILTNAESRQLHRETWGQDDEHEKPLQRPADPTGWPTALLPVGSTFSASKFFTDMKYDESNTKKKTLINHFKMDEELPFSHSVPPRSPEEILETAKKHHPAVNIDPALLQALRDCRDGFLKPNDPVWKKFDLHEIAYSLRFGSKAIHRIIARYTLDRLTQSIRELEHEDDEKLVTVLRKIVNPLDNEHWKRTRCNSLAIRQEKDDLQTDLDYRCQLCQEVLDNNNAQNADLYKSNYTDPTWFRLQQIEGWTTKQANIDLRDRIRAALNNLSHAEERGREILSWREAEYTEGKLFEPIRRTPVQWEKVEDKYNIEDDDKDVKPLYQVTRKWLIQNTEQVDTRYNLEANRSRQYETAASQDGGYYNKDDGRYHKDAPKKTVAEMIAQHNFVTANRRPCNYFLRGYCNKHYKCTMAHINRDELHARDEQEELLTYQRSMRETACDVGPLPLRKRLRGAGTKVEIVEASARFKVARQPSPIPLPPPAPLPKRKRRSCSRRR